MWRSVILGCPISLYGSSTEPEYILLFKFVGPLHSPCMPKKGTCPKLEPSTQMSAAASLVVSLNFVALGVCQLAGSL
jgi:hypothetical protein